MKNQFLTAKRYFIFFCLLLSFSSIYCQVQTPKYISICDHSNSYYEYLPQAYSSSGSQKYPLIIFSHGTGEIGDGSPSQIQRVLVHGTPQQINQGIFPVSFTVNGQAFKYIVISPQYSTNPRPSDIEQIINYAVQHYSVDTNRIYLTGLSMGGGLVWDYPGNNINYANRIAAIVPVCGSSTFSTAKCQNIAAANIPVWATHNSADPTVSVSITNNYVSTINSLPNPPNPLAKKTIFQSNTHDAWTATYNLNYRENGVNVYEWMLQYSKANGTLSISGLNFNVIKKDDKTITLNWRTLSENNNRGFEIERSSDGNSFDSIAFVPTLSADGKGADYTFTDMPPGAGKSYYRLKQINVDNSFSYGPVKYVQFTNNNYLKVYPNPVKEKLNINTSYIFSNSSLKIYDAGGSMVLQKLLNGNGIISISVTELRPGIYSAKIYDKANAVEFRFVKN